MAAQKTRVRAGHRDAAVAAIRQQRAPEPDPGVPPAGQPAAMPAEAPASEDAGTGGTIRSVTGDAIDPISLLFDTDWYRDAYPDVAAAELDPVRHFFDNGAREGRNPNPRFETSWYLATNADVVASKMNPFLHYLLYGAREGRKPRL